MILVWGWGAEDYLGRHAGQMTRSLQTSLPVVFTFYHHYNNITHRNGICVSLKIVTSFIFMITFNTAMSFSTAVILKGRNKRCWRLLLFLGNCVLLNCVYTKKNRTSEQEIHLKCRLTMLYSGWTMISWTGRRTWVKVVQSEIHCCLFDFSLGVTEKCSNQT